uniref:Uncharacterized protein n=2 Tax=Cacopsylla melanoneura TaxID=428564 RepID=A0A8D8ZR84_9HEMI
MTTLGDLFDIPSTDPFSIGVKQLASDYLPFGWREWQIKSPPALSDVKLDRSRLRFALPTIKLVKLYLPGTTHITDRQFKDMKTALFEVPFSQALITSPSGFSKALRTSEEDYAQFVEKVKPLLKFALSLTEVNRLLAAEEATSMQSQITVTADQSSGAPAIESLSPGRPSTTQVVQAHLDPVSTRLSALEEKLQSFSALESKFDALSQHLLRTSITQLSGPQPDDPEESEEEFYSDHSEPLSPAASPRYGLDVNPPGTSSSVPLLWAPESAPPECYTSAPSNEVCFDPSTVQQEPDIPEPSPRIREHLAACQLWGQEGWKRVQYKDVESKLKHAGGFPSPAS